MDTILCDELLQEIFHHHLPPSSSSSIILVSKRWHHLFLSSLSSLSLSLPLSPPSSHLSHFLSLLTSLSSLSLSSPTSLPTTTLISIISSLPHLTRLHLSTGPISPLSLLSLSKTSPLLSSLSITLSRPLLSLHILSSFTNLITLTLSLTGTASNSDHFTGIHHRLRLQSLHIIGIKSSDHALNWVWNSCDNKTLTRLVLENCEGVGDYYAYACFIKSLEGIEEVEMRTCRSIVALTLRNLSENNNRCGSLLSLVIYDGGDKEGLLHFIRDTRCDNIRKLELRLPLDLDDNHLFEIGVKFKGLRILRLQSCCMVTGEGLKTLGSALSDNLEELALTNCDIINGQDGFLVELAQNLKKIKILDLSYNHTLLDKEFSSMMSSYCNLRKLKLRGCSKLTNVSLISLCKNCKRLESVDMLYCHGIQAEGVEFMVLNSRELRSVQVEDRKLSEAARRWMKDKFIEVNTD